MVWEWSHSEEAYAFAEEKLRKLKVETLVEIANQWKTYINGKAERAYEREHEFDEADEVAEPFEPPVTVEFESMSKDCLASWVWEQASSWEHGRNCSNGGHELYLDPQGYHTVDLRDMPDDWSPSDY